ncbi:hypothetical protein HD553DRAFT_322697 [Filobasidium floriforme]|uniref:uncharacterized protein n=1 Tax=Filobasidium floriforme TaxID=5210 RepID=UPI001E8E8EF8|nr:uncharacterized protein HD553DRAFT_322697 [Filobasidium floriforme]KAH8088218.1 hypothetical protein HD553DRAFT_322697 [Filobasidium floriforme]
MVADTCSACTRSQVTHQPVTDHMSYCPEDDSFVKTGTPDDDEYYTGVIKLLNDGLTFTAEKEEYLKKWNEWMELKAMTIVPQAYNAYINGVTSERASGTDVAALIEGFTQLEESNRRQNGPDIRLEPEEKRKLALVTMAILNGIPWTLGAYRVFYYYMESEARVKDLEDEQTFELTDQTKEPSNEQ